MTPKKRDLLEAFGVLPVWVLACLRPLPFGSFPFGAPFSGTMRICEERWSEMPLVPRPAAFRSPPGSPPPGRRHALLARKLYVSKPGRRPKIWRFPTGAKGTQETRRKGFQGIKGSRPLADQKAGVRFGGRVCGKPCEIGFRGKS